MCLDHLRTRESRREDALELHAPNEMPGAECADDPHRELELADSMSLALIVVLQTLAPAEPWRSCCTTCSIFRSMRSRRSWAAPLRPRVSWRVAHGAECRARTRRSVRVSYGAQAETRGAAAVAKRFAGHAQAAMLALIDGAPGAAWAPAGKVRVLFGFAIEDGRIVAIELIAAPERLAALELEMVEE